MFENTSLGLAEWWTEMVTQTYALAVNPRQRSWCKVEARASLTGSDGQIVPSYFACVVTYLDAHLSPSCQPACKDGQMHLITCKPDNYFRHRTRLQSPFHPRCCHMIIFLAHLCYTFLIIMINLIVMITKTFFNRMWKYQSNIRVILSIILRICSGQGWSGQKCVKGAFDKSLSPPWSCTCSTALPACHRRRHHLHRQELQTHE